MNEPMWKLCLNWGVVITFLTLPLVVMVVQLYLLSHPDVIVNAEHYKDHFKYLFEFQRNLAVLIFGLSGLRTWETIKQNGKHHEPREPVHLRPGTDAERLRRGKQHPAEDPTGAEEPGGRDETQR